MKLPMSIKKFYNAALLVSLLCLAGCTKAQTSGEVSPTPTSNQAQNAEIPKLQNPGKVIHVLVALCDNENQGIVPVPKFLGNGEDPARNLYWGAAFGVKTFFSKSASWTRIAEIKNPSAKVLERIVFKHRTQNVYLVADAYRGSRMRETIDDFFAAAAGAKRENVEAQNQTLQVFASANLVAFVGHNGLMDFTLENQPAKRDDATREAVILACASRNYFTEPLRKTSAKPLLWTTNLMAPEAYILHDALEGWTRGETDAQIRTRGASLQQISKNQFKSRAESSGDRLVKMKKSAYFLFLLLFIYPLDFSFAQEKPGGAQASEWRRLESDNGEFSVEMPANYTYFYDRDGFLFEDGGSVLHFPEMQMLNASQGKTVVSVEIYKARSPKKHLDYLLERQNLKASKLADAPENFTVKQVDKPSLRRYYNQEEETEISFAMRFIASKTHLYIVTVANRGATKTADFERVLASIRLNENQSGNTKISSLKASRLEDIGEDLTNLPKPPEAPPNQSKPSDAPRNPTPILILAKPFAPYTDEARANLVSGTIRLRVTFNKNGGISKIALLSGLKHGLNRGAFFAALRVKFIPEEKDGVPVTVTKMIEYAFSIGR
jgi:TonB family protein